MIPQGSPFAMWGYNQKKEPSPDHADTLISRTASNRLLLFMHYSVYGILLQQTKWLRHKIGTKGGIAAVTNTQKCGDVFGTGLWVQTRRVLRYMLEKAYIAANEWLWLILRRAQKRNTIAKTSVFLEKN